jgi:hypothetical protein
MKLSLIRIGSKSNRKRRTIFETETKTGKPCGDKGRDEADLYQGKPRMAS